MFIKIFLAVIVAFAAYFGYLVSMFGKFAPMLLKFQIMGLFGIKPEAQRN